MDNLISYEVRKESILAVLAEKGITDQATIKKMSPTIDKCIEAAVKLANEKGEIKFPDESSILVPHTDDVKAKIKEMCYDSVGESAMLLFWSRLKRRIDTGKWGM